MVLIQIILADLPPMEEIGPRSGLCMGATRVHPQIETAIGLVISQTILHDAAIAVLEGSM